MESNTAIPENKWPYVKDRILAKLKRRKIVNTSHDDPKLVEQVHKNITLIDTGYFRYISMKKAIKAKVELWIMRAYDPWAWTGDISDQHIG